MSDTPQKLQVVHDEASGFWTGKPWLVIAEEGEPATASFKTDREAFDFVDDSSDDVTDEQMDLSRPDIFEPEERL